MTVTYEAILSTTLVSAQSSVVIGSGGTIPQTYTDLILVISYTGTLSSAEARIQLNGDTGSNYSWTQLYGNGSSAASYRASNVTNLPVLPNEASSTTVPSVFVLNFQNYSNTTTNKTVLYRSSITSLATTANVGLWRNTGAITSINVFTNASTFTAGSTFSLYGIKAE
jgi:hypothetical protein